MADNDKPTPEDDSSLNDYQKEEIKKTREQAGFQKQIEHELATEERFQKYFEGFNSESVKSFITSYAQKKAYWYRFGNFWIEQNEAEDLQWINEAEIHLSYIQQKKLFDAQCLWRAEKITIPEVEICFDFEMWERDVMNCPFIEPVNENEVELYVQYLSQNNVDLELGWMESWQDYHEIKEAYNDVSDTRNFPEWYDFYNGRMGTSTYMLLPDIRGEKEEFYDGLSREKEKPERDAKQKEWDRIRDKRPHLKSIYDKELLEYFVRTFDNKQTQEYFEADKRYNRVSGDEESLQEDIDFLLKADEPIAISGHHDWKEAVHKTAEQYRLKKIAEYLPAAFEQYQLNLSMGILPSNKEARQNYDTIRKIWADYILNGREINGEPRDFNF